jgi:hypothetical protein
MAIVDLVMPKLGESIMEATVLKWYKKPGDAVKQDETVLDIATDKVDSEVPSTAAGTITELLYKENDVVPNSLKRQSLLKSHRKKIRTTMCLTYPSQLHRLHLPAATVFTRRW